MTVKQIKIGTISALLYGDKSDKLFIYVHGRYANKEDAGGFSWILTTRGYQVLSFEQLRLMVKSSVAQNKTKRDTIQH